MLKARICRKRNSKGIAYLTYPQPFSRIHRKVPRQVVNVHRLAVNSCSPLNPISKSHILCRPLWELGPEECQRFDSTRQPCMGQDKLSSLVLVRLTLSLREHLERQNLFCESCQSCSPETWKSYPQQSRSCSFSSHPASPALPAWSRAISNAFDSRWRYRSAGKPFMSALNSKAPCIPAHISRNSCSPGRAHSDEGKEPAIRGLVSTIAVPSVLVFCRRRPDSL